MKQRLPIGIQDFADLRTSGYKYVDKTGMLYDLVNRGKYFFLSRPRRFGKSLLLSTLEAYFKGRKDLFDGLAIAELEKDWVEYPVLHIDFNTGDYSAENDLANKLNGWLFEHEEKYGHLKYEASFGVRFEQLIKKMAQCHNRKVVILIDEYDKPIFKTLNNQPLQEKYRSALKDFYGALKSADGSIHFAFLTGVTKVGKVSIFSDLNNLKDISMEMRYHSICGITEDELVKSFEEELDALSSSLGLPKQETLAVLKEHYDGYHFCEANEGLYNPFSLLNAFDSNKLGSYWFETGTPTDLAKLLKENNYDLSALEGKKYRGSTLNLVDQDVVNPVPVIFQSGYLTIKGYDPEFDLYTLGYPNREVKEGFLQFLLPYYANTNGKDSQAVISELMHSLREGDVDAFLRHISTFLSGCPYELQAEQERHFQTVMYTIATLCGYFTFVEEHTSLGRMDMTVRTDKYFYIFEMKFDHNAEEALEQIDEKNYAAGMADSHKQVICVGVNYSSKIRNIDSWKIRKL